MALCALLALLTGLAYARFAARAAYGFGAELRLAEYKKIQTYDFSNLNPSAHVIAYRHQNNMASNVTFFDGHVETKTAATLNPYNSATMWGSGNLNMRQYVAYDN